MKPFIHSHTRPPTPPVGAKRHHGAGAKVRDKQPTEGETPDNVLFAGADFRVVATSYAPLAARVEDNPTPPTGSLPRASQAAPRERWRLELVDAGGIAPPHRRLARFLKSALRAYGLRCTKVEAATPNAATEGTTGKRGAVLGHGGGER